MLTRARWLPCGHAVTLLAELGQSREEMLPIRVGQASEMPESPPSSEASGEGIYSFASRWRILSIQLWAGAETCTHCRAHCTQISVDPRVPSLVSAGVWLSSLKYQQLLHSWCSVERRVQPLSFHSCLVQSRLVGWVVRKICSSAPSAIWEPRQSPVDRELKAVPQRTKPTSRLERWESLCLRALKMQMSARVGSAG